MNVNTMRQIDRFAGIPLCWLLGLIHRSIPSRRTGLDPQHARNVLVIKFFGMGSILLSTPALQLIKKAFPQARITYLSFRTNAGLLERLPLVDEVITIDSSSLLPMMRDILTTFVHLRRTRFDIVFDFEFFSKFSTLVSGVARSRRRVGFELPVKWRTMILTDEVNLSKDKHVTESFCDQVFALTARTPVPPVLPPCIREQDRVSLADQFDPDESPIICINVNAGETFLERRWKPERFSELLDSLAALHPDYHFTFIGSAQERDYVQSVITGSGAEQMCFNLAGSTQFGELAALLERCELMISNDSGPLHLAAALGKPCIAMYGPESPRFYGPVGGHSTIIYKAISCSPCMNVYDAKTFRCPYHARCMSEIQVSEIERAFESFRIAC